MAHTASSQEKSSKFALCINELRAPFITASVLPMALGVALAYSGQSNTAPVLTFFTFLCGTLIHLSANTLNDLFDFKAGCDTPQVNKTPFSGGSGMLAGGLLSYTEVKTISTILVAASLATGGAVIALSPGDRSVLLIFGAIGLFLGIAYTAPPFKLVYKGLGEIAIFLAFGPLPVVSAYYITSGTFSLASFIASIPAGLMTTAILWINQFPDYSSDKKADKNNLVVVMGREKSRYVYYLLVFLSVLVVLAAALSGILQKWSLLGLFFLFPALAASFILHKNFKDTPKMIPAMGLTILSHLVLTVLMITGVLL